MELKSGSDNVRSFKYRSVPQIIQNRRPSLIISLHHNWQSITKCYIIHKCYIITYVSIKNWYFHFSYSKYAISAIFTASLVREGGRRVDVFVQCVRFPVAYGIRGGEQLYGTRRHEGHERLFGRGSSRGHRRLQGKLEKVTAQYLTNASLTSQNW